MKDPFKKIYKDIEPPLELKKQVLDELYALRFLGEVVDLFTVKFVKAELDFLSDLDEGDSDETDHERRIK